MKCVLLLLVTVNTIHYGFPLGILTPNISEIGRLDFCGVANKNGFQCNDYEIVTEDGYILKVFRIPGDTNKTVFLMHGLQGSSDDFIMRSNTSLIIMLAKAGYDVWAGNIRGNRYSRHHIHFDPDLDKKDFFDFSIDEQALIDLPAMLDLTFKTTNQTKIYYIGHSQGTTNLFALAAEKPEYNQKIKLFVSLAPFWYLEKSDEPFLGVLRAGYYLFPALEFLGVEEIVGYNSPTKKAIDVLCTHGQTSYDVCVKGVIFPFVGFNEKELEVDFLPDLFGHYPAGTSRKNLVQYSQLAVKKRVQKFDNGILKNKLQYGSETPPEYDIKKVTMKVALFVGKNDKLAPIKMAESIKQNLPNVVRYTEVEDDKWNHFDHLVAINAYRYLYPDVLDVLEQF